MISQDFDKWFMDDGDSTHSINHQLDENSFVMDLGGYTGIWSQKIIDKYNCNVFIIEPVKEFHNILLDKYRHNPKVHILNVGVSTEDCLGGIHIDGDRTSTNINQGVFQEVEFNTLNTIMNKFKIDKIDLLQINIEGDEYKLLEYLHNNLELFRSIKKYQIQFHTNVDNCEIRRGIIQQNFINNGYEKTYDYPFIWECWKLKNNSIYKFDVKICDTSVSHV